MGEPEYVYDDDIPENDRKILDEKKNAILRGLERKSIRWIRIMDSTERNHYRATAYSDGSCLCQIVIDDIRNLEDDEIVANILGGKWQEIEIA